MKTQLISLIISLLPLLSHAQTSTQNLTGTVLDKDSRQPLVGATVSLRDVSPLVGGTTDEAGKFTLRSPVGRVVVQCSYLGYETWVSDALIVNSARETNLQIELTEAAVKSTEVVVTATRRGSDPINEASLLSARSFSVDETQRYAASANDPGRMAMSFPGVQPSRDSRSDIIVRGNSGIGLLWRLEGIDIPNPNHFARRGSSGGGITIFSISMLANSDFSTGAFPAEYGNAYSGVFDVRLRKGNADKREYTFRAGMLGLDFSTEGPFRKGGGATYLVNYRYSTLGILNKLGLHLVGERVDNTFQDLSFNLHLPTKNKRHLFTLWGIGGLSHETENAVENTADWKSYTDYFTRDFDTNMGAVGATHSVLLPGDAYVKTSVAAMGQHIDFVNDTLNAARARFTVNDERYTEKRLVLSSFLNKKISPRASLKTGFFLTEMPYKFDRTTLGDSTSLGADGTVRLVQTYAQLRLRPAPRWTLNVGLHTLSFELNRSYSIEPRLNAKYDFSENQSLSLAWGLHGRVLPLGNYFTRINGVEVNRDAGLIRAQHTVAAYDLTFARTRRLHAEVYFQYMRDVPVAATPGSSWSILNTIDGFAKHQLINKGMGYNLGLDVSVEQAFSGGTFLIAGGSWSRSRYTDANEREHSTAFDSGLSAMLTSGQEWTLKKSAVLQISSKNLYNGGQRLTPLLAGQTVSRFSPEPLLDEARAFSEKVAAYFRSDLRVAYRKNNPKNAWSLALDIQNLTNRRNIDPLNRTYDPDLNQWVFREQSGLTPILLFQIDF